MNRTYPTELTILLQRRHGWDQTNAGDAFAEYDIAWPDGRPVQVGLRRFCRIGSRLLIGRKNQEDSALVRLTVYPVTGLEAPLTRPGRGIRCRRLYAVRQPEHIRLYFLDGTPTEATFDPQTDEREVLRWLQTERMRPSEPFWFDLASETVTEVSCVPVGVGQHGR